MTETDTRLRQIVPVDAAPRTVAVRAGQVRSHESEHNDPIYATSSFVFDSAAQAAARFAETEPGNVYSRFTNPTVRTFEQRLAAMEGAQHAVATGLRLGDDIQSANTDLSRGWQ